MKYSEFKAQYLTPENILEYSRQTDSMVWVSDLTGLSIDHAWVYWLTRAFDDATGDVETFRAQMLTIMDETQRLLDRLSEQRGIDK